jgi:hypothetical protein
VPCSGSCSGDKSRGWFSRRTRLPRFTFQCQETRNRYPRSGLFPHFDFVNCCCSSRCCSPECVPVFPKSTGCAQPELLSTELPGLLLASYFGNAKASVLGSDCCLCWLWFVAGCITGVLLSHRIEKLEDSWSKLFSGGSFSNTPTKCSVKCPRGDKLFSESICVVELSRDLTSTIPCFPCGSESTSEG